MAETKAEKVRVERQIGKSTLWIETGYLAKQAAGSCLVGYGNTVVFAATATSAPRPGIDFFPLMVDYRERHASAGLFPGGFLKREGRPSMKETLTSRLIDRPLRPLFPEWFNDEVQIMCACLASDKLNDSDILALNAAATSLELTAMPFEGPLAGVRMGRIDGELVVFPTQEELEASDLDLVVAGNHDNILMIEGFSREMPEEEMVEAVLECHKYIREICELQKELVEKVGVQKTEYEIPEPLSLIQTLKDRYWEDFKTAKLTPGKHDRSDAVRAVKERVISELIPDPEAEDAIDMKEFGKAWHDFEAEVVRETILTGVRPDGRAPGELRDIECQVDLLPCVHGSAVFQRGETQALVTITLGTSRDEQKVDGPFEDYSKKFMLDYYFPPYSVGECRPIRGPGRREIGHGALAERSVKSVMPGPDEFPYTVRVISDIMESNGSSSMASVCGATLGLMAAGVPITNPVAGISIGLVKKDEDNFTLLTDIMGDEDHFGDMDFKVAGTQNGVTGIQLDLKIKGISERIIRDTLQQAREARIEILRKMLTTIRQPREELAASAPRLLTTHIPPDKIGMLIGPGGKNIRSIQEDTGASLDVDDDGTVVIASDNMEAANAALARVEAFTATVQVGKVYKGRVSSVKDFGVFVEVIPGRDGLCHISELDVNFVNNITDICNVGDELEVKVIAIDEHDRVKLSRKALLAPEGEDEEGESAPRGEGGGGGGGRSRRDDRGDRGDRGGDRGPRRRRGGDGGGRREYARD